ncbi:MAG: hypothetical protein ACRD0A_04765 [Acidimicrobiales bacterium]
MTLARGEGLTIGPVSYVVVSSEPRTLETALAMGFAVDQITHLEPPILTGSVVFHEWWNWTNPFAEFRRRIETSTALAHYARRQQAILASVANHVDDDETALVIGHGGWIEPVLVTCLPDDDVWAWGGPFRHLEGARLQRNGNQWSLVSLHRIRGAREDP